MSDYNSSLPVRTENDGDVAVVVGDATTPSQQLAVNSDGQAKVEVYGDNPAGGNEVLKLSELGNANSDAIYHATDNTIPSTSGLVSSSRSATPGNSTMTLRPSSVAGASNSICLDVSLHDESGAVFSASNPLPVSFEESEGDEKCDYEEETALAAAASATHLYSVASTKTFLLRGIQSSGSGKMKMKLEIGDGALSEVFAVKGVQYNSTATPDCFFQLDVPIKVVGTANTTTIKVTLTNRDNQAQDVHSSIVGLERNT